MDARTINYYADLICKKIDLETEAFVERIKAIESGDEEEVEFIEEMMLKPVAYQIRYLANKVIRKYQEEHERRNAR
jgi:hypothetical protein